MDAPMLNQEENVDTDLGQMLTQEEVNRKKKSFFKIVRIIIFVLVGLFVLTYIASFGTKLYVQNKKRFEVVERKEITNNPAEIVTETKEEILLDEYKNDTYRINFKYLSGDILNVKETENFYVEIIGENSIPLENVTGDILIDGYIFKIVPFKVSNRNIQEVAQIKRISFIENCPEYATFGEIYSTKIDDLESLTFEVNSCNSSYIVSFVYANGYIYEISQIYRGDIGKRQVYKSATRDILNSLKIDRDFIEITHETYNIRNTNIKFEYPKTLDTSCCRSPIPPGKTSRFEATFSEGENSKALSLYWIDKFNSSFEELIASQKNLLIDDYTIVKGAAPQGIETEMYISGAKAYKLENYTWSGNTLLYIDPPNSRSVMVFSYTDISREILDSILSSLSFN